MRKAAKAAKRETPSHCSCPHCKHKMKMVMYVYAHWNDEFTVTCDKCGKQFHMHQGRTWK